MNNPNKAMFDSIFNRISTEIEFDAKWNNGTGYFDNAVKVGLEPGKRAKSTCPESGRRLILVGTAVGTAVFFERYAQPTDRFIITSNIPQAIRFIIPSGALTGDQLHGAAGGDTMNIGRSISDLLNEVVRISAIDAEIDPEIFKAPVQRSYAEDN